MSSQSQMFLAHYNLAILRNHYSDIALIGIFMMCICAIYIAITLISKIAKDNRNVLMSIFGVVYIIGLVISIIGIFPNLTLSHTASANAHTDRIIVRDDNYIRHNKNNSSKSRRVYQYHKYLRQTKPRYINMKLK